jgi:protein Tex
VKWLWPKAYEQAIWFLRIKWGKEVLDATGIHPEIHKKCMNFLKQNLESKKRIKLPMAVEKFLIIKIARMGW